MTGFRYAVDLDLLADTVAALQRGAGGFDRLSDELGAHVAALHLTWTGEAATAHATAQAQWEQGFAAMREGLAEMHDAARSAHRSYTAAVDANVRIWGQR